LLLLLAAAVASAIVRPGDLLDRQLRFQRSVGEPDLNEKLYQYAASGDLERDVVTDYPLLGWLPELDRHYRPLESGDMTAFRSVYERPEVGFALMHKNQAASPIGLYLEESCRSGASHVALESDHYRLFRKDEKR
jgi:hypothetical protein